MDIVGGLGAIGVIARSALALSVLLGGVQEPVEY